MYPTHGKVDLKTQGSWIGRYGKAGYILFGFDQGKTLAELPEFVTSWSIFKNGSSQTAWVGTDPKNASYLQDPRGGGGRQLGFVSSGADGSQGTVLDIDIAANVSYQLALYSVANVKPEGRRTWSASRQAIRVLDLETMDVIAPTPLIQDFDGGAYFVLRYNRGVRLRVMPVDSDAGFSAVFFDKQ